MVSSKTERKVMKKMSRVLAAASPTQQPQAAAAGSSGAGSVPQALVPAPLPANDNLMTRREVLLKKSFARRAKKDEQSSSAAQSAGKKKLKLDKSAARRPGVQQKKVTADANAGPSTTLNAKLATRPDTAKSKAKSDPKASKLVAGALHAVSKQQAARAQPITTQNLSSARRHDFFVKELNQFNKVLALPEFKKDPFAAIESHLDLTMKKLEPQTADFGRRPLAAAAGQPPKQHASYNQTRPSHQQQQTRGTPRR